MARRPSGPSPPTGDESLRGDDSDWCLHDDRTGIRVELPTLTVTDHTLVYEDDALRERVRTATGVDRTWRFFFATSLSFTPPLPPLTGTASVFGSVRSEARSAFVDDLQRRGVRSVQRVGRDRVRAATGDRITLTRYRGHLPAATLGDATDELPVSALLGVWTVDGEFRLAGGGYPEVSLSSVLDGAPETEPSAMRNELLELLRGPR